MRAYTYTCIHITIRISRKIAYKARNKSLHTAHVFKCIIICTVCYCQSGYCGGVGLYD